MVGFLPPGSRTPDKFALVRSHLGIHVLSYWHGGDWAMSTAIKGAVLDDSVWILSTNSGSKYQIYPKRAEVNPRMAELFNMFELSARDEGKTFEWVDEQDYFKTLLSLV